MIQLIQQRLFPVFHPLVRADSFADQIVIIAIACSLTSQS